MPSGITVETPVPASNVENASAKNENNDGDLKSNNKKPEIKDENKSNNEGKLKTDGANEDSVEVVLNDEGSTDIVEEKVKPDQDVFRRPDNVQRPRAMRAPPVSGSGPPPPPPHHLPPPYPHYPYPVHSGSWGYGPPMPPDAYRGHHPHHPPPPPPHHHPPYPVPPYPTSSGSFDDHHGPPPHYHHTPHYSPHIQYPGPRYSSGEEVNVISPNHKPDPHYGPPGTPRSRSAPHYQYPPTSPVSRPGQGPPRLRNYAMRRGGDGAYSRAQRPDYEDSSPYHPYGPPPPPPPPPRPEENAGSTSKNIKNSPVRSQQPPVVAESFDSMHPSQRNSRPNTPKSSGSKPVPTPSSDPHFSIYGGGSWGSFDSAAPPPPHFDDGRYYGFPPDSPYSPYQQPYSPGALYHAESFPSPHVGYGPPPLPPTFSYSYDEEDRLLKDYHPDDDGKEKYVTPPGNTKKSRTKSSTPVSSNISSRNVLLPKAAEEVDFDIADPPMEPVTPESTDPVCESMGDVNSYDVLCGRGGGTNSQIGNRRFRQLVQEFQPTYLMAKRKEKPLLARTIVLIIRKRGGRFLKKNEDSGELYEVGDTKAEAKTSQALREGLDVRATKSAANAMAKKEKDKKKKTKASSPDTTSPEQKTKEEESEEPTSRSTESPPTLPKLPGEETTAAAGQVHPHSPDHAALRKRRRVRSADKFFNDFMPPRAELGRHEDDDGLLDEPGTPIRRNGTRDDDDAGPNDCGVGGCAGIALDIVTGAAKGSFCLAPSGWGR